MNKKKWYKMLDHLIVISLMLLVMIFILLPFLLVFRQAFWVDGDYSFQHFIDLFNHDRYLLWNSLKMASLTTLLTTFISVIVALYAVMSPKWLRRLIMIILSITMISPPFVTSLSYITLFGRRGMITYDLLHLRISPYGMWGIVLMQTLGGFPLKSLLLIRALDQVDTAMIQSARSLGAKTSDLIRDVLIPSIRPTIHIVMLLTFLGSLSDFGTPTIIGGSFEVLATESYLSVIAQGNLSKAAAINVIILLPAFLAFILYIQTFKEGVSVGKGSQHSTIQYLRKGLLFQIIRLLSIFSLSWISLQYLAIVLTAFTKHRRGHLVFTLQHFSKALPYLNAVVSRSITYALIATLVGSLIGLFIGYYLKIRKIPLMSWIDFSATLPYIIPGTFFGLGYILAFKGFPWYLTGTSMIVVLNLIFKQMPFSTKVGAAAMEDISPDMLRSVSDLGGSRIDEIRDVILPISFNTLVVSFANSFTETMTTIGSIIFLVTPSTKLLTKVLFELVSGSKYDVASVLALFIMLICLSVNLQFLSLNHWRK